MSGFQTFLRSFLPISQKLCSNTLWEVRRWWQNVTKHKVANLCVRLLRGVGLRGALIGRGHHGGDGGWRVQLVGGAWVIQSRLFGVLGQRQRRRRPLRTLLL